MASKFPHGLAGRVLVVRSDASFSMEGFEEIAIEAEHLRQKLGQPLIYWALMTSKHLSIPPNDARPHIQKYSQRMMRSCERMVLVFDGNGVTDTLLRSMLRAMVLAAGHRGRVFIVDSLPAALEASGPSLGASPSAITSLAESLMGASGNKSASAGPGA